MQKRISNVISIIFSPLLIAPLTIFLISLSLSPSIKKSLTYTFVFIITTILPTLVYIVVQMKRGVISDMHVKNKEQRNIIYLIGMTSVVACLVVMRLISVPNRILAIVVTQLLTAAISYLINKKIKLSLHTATMVGSTVILHFIFGYKLALIGLLFTILTMWSRLTLKAHNFNEVVIGFLTGSIITLGMFKFLFYL